MHWYRIKNSSIDLERQNALKEVLIVRRVRNIELAEAFYNTQILDGASNFVKNNDQFEAYALNGKIKKQVILVSLQASYIGLALLLVANLMLCIVPGILVGTVNESVDLGIAVSSGIAGVLSFLSAILIVVWGRNIRNIQNETWNKDRDELEDGNTDQWIGVKRGFHVKNSGRLGNGKHEILSKRPWAYTVSASPIKITTSHDLETWKLHFNVTDCRPYFTAVLTQKFSSHTC